MFGTLVTIFHIFACFVLILVVLLQAGKGGGMGITFGGGGSQTVFGSSGAGNFLTRMTAICAAIFMMTSLGLARQSSQQDSKRLQELAEKKALEKKTLDESNAKAKTDLDKAREAIEKATGQKVQVSAPPDGGFKTPEQEIQEPMFDKKKADAPGKGPGAAAEGAGAGAGDKGKPEAAKGDAVAAKGAAAKGDDGKANAAKAEGKSGGGPRADAPPAGDGKAKPAPAAADKETAPKKKAPKPAADKAAGEAEKAPAAGKPPAEPAAPPSP